MSHNARALAVLLAILVTVAGLPAPAAAASACPLPADPARAFALSTDLSPSMSMRGGCATQAPPDLAALATGGDDLVMVADYLGENISASLRRAADDVRLAQSRGQTLGQYLQAQATQNATGLYPPVTDIDLEGSVHAAGNSLVLVVPAAEVGVAANWWQKTIASWTAFAVGLFVGAICLASFAEGAPLAAPVCGAIGGFLNGLVNELMNAAFDGRPLGSSDVMAEAFAVAMSQAAQGAIYGAILAATEKIALPVVTGIQKLIRKATAWAGGGPLQAVVDLIQNLGPEMIRKLRRMQNSVGGAASLRVLPLGDSITRGTGVPDQSSYRARLYEQLGVGTDSLDFVGSQDSGDLSDTDHEGHSGWRIDQIDDIVDCTIRRYRPNVVTLHLGTNDMNQDYQVDRAPQRLRALLDRIGTLDPNVTILLATLIPSRNAAVDARIRQYNAAIPGVVAALRAEGRFVRLVDMSAVTTADLSDSLHPNATGYRKMADAFHRGIRSSLADGWQYRPAVANPAACGPEPGTGTAPTQPDPAADMGDGWDRQGEIAPGVGVGREAVRFADVDGDGRDDYLTVDSAGRVRAWLNVRATSGAISWRAQGEIASGVGAAREAVRFADVDGDSRADYLVLDGAGRIRAWLNNIGGRGGSWQEKGEIASGVGSTRDRVVLSDVSGDGRDDYLVLGDLGQVRAWLNDFGAGGGRWVAQGEISAGAGVTRAVVGFADIDADNHTDYLVVRDDSAVIAWQNDRYPQPDRWDWQGTVAAGVGATRPEVRFADVDGDGRDDYLVLDGAGRIRAWYNDVGGVGGWWHEKGEIASGVGATRDQVRFADINGDRRDDYLVVDDAGRVRAWINNIGGVGGSWQEKGEIASGVGAARHQVRLAAFNDDGHADHLVVRGDGRITAWTATGAGWQAQGVVGAGLDGSVEQVELADLNGDGRADWLVVDDAGRVRAWTNNGIERKAPAEVG